MRTNVTSTSEDPIIIRICEVKSVVDDNAGLRIKVRLEPEDGDIDDDANLPYCFPLMPKMIHINPKVGESVLVFLSVQGRPRGSRFFIGPLISQPYSIDFDPHNFSARCLLPGFKNIDKPLPDPQLDPDNHGTLPEREDIAILGRNNTAIILKDRSEKQATPTPPELRLLCGHKKNTTGPRKNSLQFNKKDLGYIQMRYKKMQDRKKQDFASVVNIVADRINLLSHKSAPFTLNDKKELITDKELANILDTAHPMIHGDELIQVLKELVEIFRVHEHNSTNEAPAFTDPELEYLGTINDRLQETLSKTIHIN